MEVGPDTPAKKKIYYNVELYNKYDDSIYIDNLNDIINLSILEKYT